MEGQGRTPFQRLTQLDGLRITKVIQQFRESSLDSLPGLCQSVGLPTINSGVTDAFASLVDQGIFAEPLEANETVLLRAVKSNQSKAKAICNSFIQTLKNDPACALINNIEPILDYLEYNSHTHAAVEILGLLGKDKQFVKNIKDGFDRPKYPRVLACYEIQENG